MRLDEQEVQAIAAALAPRVADILEQRLSELPEWAMSIQEAAAWVRTETHVIRDAVTSGRLPCVQVGRTIRIRRSDLFGLNRERFEDDK